MNTNLTDIYEIHPGQQILDMSATEKAELIDATTSIKNGKKRGLVITFDLSSSFRVTNNRLYTAKGQQDGIGTWTSPYPKPILVHHDKKSDPLGRFASVEWVSNEKLIMKFFKSTQDFMDFKRMLDSGDPKKIYKAMYDRDLLTNDSWPGLGRLVAKARISDADAIEKFLDGRYLTFSAGSRTDKMYCGCCGQDWGAEGPCDHLPGSIDEDGRPVVMITGLFAGREASVVTSPGNDLSQLTHMEFGDSMELTDACLQATRYSNSKLTFTDASVDMEDLMNTSDTDLQQAVELLKSMDARDVARNLWNGTLTQEQNDALAGKSHFETTWLIRIHDALHHEYDWGLRYGEDSAVPEAVFAFHGDLHELSSSKGFRDSMINGALDDFDKKGAGSEEYKAKRAKNNDAAEEALTPAQSMAMLLADTDALAALKAALAQPEDNGETMADTETPSGSAEPVVKVSTLTDLNWYLLGVALAHELGDAALDDEATAALDEKAFIGPERSFPVADAKHLEAAQRVIAHARFTEDQKVEFEAALNERIETFEIVQVTEDARVEGLVAELAAMTADYQQSLKVASDLQTEVDSLNERLALLDTSEKTGQNNKNLPSVEDIKPVEDESASGSQNLSDSTKELGNYEKGIVSKYKELRDLQGERAANHFLYGKIARGHLPRTFDITPHIQENE